MSKITSLATRNIKGFDLNENLTGREIYLGPNGSGKSARLESLIFGMHGCLPWLGKKEETTFQLSSGEFMTVNLSTDGGFSFGRTIRRKVTKHRDDTKSYRYTASYSVFPDQGEQTAKEKAQRIVDEIGSFPMMFDLNEFMGMSDDKKRAFIFSLSSPEKHGWDRQRVMDVLEDLKADTDTVSEMWGDDQGLIFNVLMIDIELRKQLRDAKAVKKDKDAAKVEIIKMRQEMTEEATESLSVINEKLTDHTKQREDTRVEIARAEEASKNHKALVGELQKIRDERLDNSSVGKHDVPAAEKEHEEAIQKEADLGSQLDESQRHTSKLQETLRTLESDKGTCERELAAGDKRSHIQEMIDTIDKVGCPLAGEECKTDLSAYKESLKEKWQENDDLVNETLRPGRDRVLIEIGKTEQRAIGSQKKSRALRKEITEARKDTKAKRATANKFIKENDETSNLSSSLEKEESRVNGLLKSSTPGSDTTAQSRMLEGLEHQINQLEQDRKKQESILSVEVNFEKANVAAAEAEEKVEDLDALVKALGPSGLQKQIMDDVIGPISTTINNLLKHIPSEDGSEYKIQFNLFDMNGKESFEIVRPMGGFEISYHSLSGGQQILFGTALIVALVLLADPPTKVMCIEAAELDSENFFRLLKALDSIGEDIDNIMVASCNDDIVSQLEASEVDKIGSWSVIKLSNTEVVPG